MLVCCQFFLFGFFFYVRVLSETLPLIIKEGCARMCKTVQHAQYNLEYVLPFKKKKKDMIKVTALFAYVM